MDPVEWERRAYGWGCSRAEIRTMSLREYALRSQSDLRREVREWTRTLAVVNCFAEQPVTISDVFDGRVSRSTPSAEFKAWVYDVKARRDDLDWTLVDAQLSPPSTSTG